MPSQRYLVALLVSDHHHSVGHVPESSRFPDSPWPSNVRCNVVVWAPESVAQFISLDEERVKLGSKSVVISKLLEVWLK